MLKYYIIYIISIICTHTRRDMSYLHPSIIQLLSVLDHRACSGAYRHPQQVLDTMVRVHVNVPCFDILLSSRSLGQCTCIYFAMEALGYRKATSEQMETIKNFVLGRDVITN
jgi:hypothetical protein